MLSPRRPRSSPAVLLVLGALAVGAGQGAHSAEVAFRDVARESGIAFVHEKAEFDPQLARIMPWLSSLNAGVALADYDGDGDDDLYFASSAVGAANELYRNDGGFRFVEVGGESGAAALNDAEGVSMSALFVDLDNDEDQDLVVAGYGRSRLLENAGGRLVEASARRGFTGRHNAAAVVALDLENDGWLDLALGTYFEAVDLWHLPSTRILPSNFERARNGGADLFFHNQGGGTFREVAAQLGVGDTGWALALGAGDLDGDGDSELYVANDYGEDVLYRNDGEGRLAVVTRQATGGDFASGMNVELGDYDNDGDLDLYVTNIANAVIRQGNMLWSNQGELVFTDEAMARGVWDGGWGWGAKFLDVDNDGDLDLYTANGFVSAGPVDIFRAGDSLYRQFTAEDISDLAQWPDMRGLSLSGYERNRLFRNDGERFSEVAAAAGVDSARDGRGVAIADLDGDGGLEIVVSNCGQAPHLYRNFVAGQGSWLALRLAGTVSNRDAIGARVEVEAGDLRLLREVDGGNGFSAQSSRTLHFGLGGRKRAERVRIRWPSGRRRILTDLPAATRVVVVE